MILTMTIQRAIVGKAMKRSKGKEGTRKPSARKEKEVAIGKDNNKKGKGTNHDNPRSHDKEKEDRFRMEVVS